MPGRRVFRYKARVKPLTKAEWMFFLATDVAGMDAAFAEDGEEFFFLYYTDGWTECLAEHREEIEDEWRKRGWTAKQKKFVMTPYIERGYVLKQDRERDERSRIWNAWRNAPEPKTNDWREHLASIGRLDLHQDLGATKTEKKGKNNASLK